MAATFFVRSPFLGDPHHSDSIRGSILSIDPTNSAFTMWTADGR